MLLQKKCTGRTESQTTVPDKRNCITGGLSTSVTTNIVIACKSKENDNIIKILTLYAASKKKKNTRKLTSILKTAITAIKLKLPK